jgi:hypothetical protein
MSSGLTNFNRFNTFSCSNMTTSETSTALFSGMSPDMIIGMVLGMIASPLMMKGIKILKHRRKMNRLFREIAEARLSKGIGDDSLSSLDNDREKNSLEGRKTTEPGRIQ